MRQQRSLAKALIGKIAGGLLEPDPPSSPPFDPLEELVEAGPLHKPGKLVHEVLLQRLTAPLGTALQRRMNLVGKTPNEDARHACTMLARAAGPGWTPEGERATARPAPASPVRAFLGGRTGSARFEAA